MSDTHKKKPNMRQCINATSFQFFTTNIDAHNNYFKDMTK